MLEFLATNDSCVVGVCKSGSRHLDELKQKFIGNQKVTILEADVTDLQSMEAVASELRKQKIQVDIVLSNAGVITSSKPFWEVSKEEIDETYKVNIRGVFNTMKVFYPLLKTVQGSVIANVSSDWGICGSQGRSAYCMSKFAVEGLTKTGALDVEKDQVCIVTVSPGMVHSDMLIEAYGEEESRKIGVPLKEFVPQFVDRLCSIDKSQNGQHLDLSHKSAHRAA